MAANLQHAVSRCSETLLTIAADPKHLGASLGFLTVLDTWGQNLHLHPHVHSVAPGAGISPDGSRWIHCRKSFFLPVKVLSRLFRRKFLVYLIKAFQKNKLRLLGDLEPLAKPSAFEAICKKAANREWVVYAKPPFRGPEQTLKYLARYTHRVAISNSRILSLEDGRVTFKSKDYGDENKKKTMTLEVVEFIRRFLQHVVPSGFVRIRHFGFLANQTRQKNLAACRSLLGVGFQPVATCSATFSPRWNHQGRFRSRLASGHFSRYVMIVRLLNSESRSPSLLWDEGRPLCRIQFSNATYQFESLQMSQ